jgi:hypothetical protein
MWFWRCGPRAICCPACRTRLRVYEVRFLGTAIRSSPSRSRLESDEGIGEATRAALELSTSSGIIDVGGGRRHAEIDHGPSTAAESRRKEASMPPRGAGVLAPREVCFCRRVPRHTADTQLR